MTIQTLASYLDRFGWKQYEIRLQRAEREGLLVVDWFQGPLDNSFQLKIDLIVEPGLLVFRSEKLAAIPNPIDDKTKIEILEALAQRNSVVFLGSFGMSRSGKTVDYHLVVPLDSGELTYERFISFLRWAKSACESCGSSVFGTLDTAGPKWSDQEDIGIESARLIKYFNERMRDDEDETGLDEGE